MGIFKNNVNIISKTEFGGSIFINNTPLECGTLFRINKINNDPNLQTFIPIIRYRINQGKHLYIISYSYDANISNNKNSLQFVNTGTTYEIGFTIYLFSGNNKNKDCAAFQKMENNALYQDIMKNGLLNNKKRKKNFF